MEITANENIKWKSFMDGLLIGLRMVLWINSLMNRNELVKITSTI